MNAMKNFLIFLAVSTLCILTNVSVFGQENYDQGHVNKDKSGIAIEGYDPVSYFLEDEPEEGDEKYQHTYNSATYLFKNEENLKTFKSNPDAYIPQYGGWCAFAMGVTGNKVKVDPETFKMYDGMLYLFYNFRFNNTLTKWNEDEANLKPKADKYWKNTVAN